MEPTHLLQALHVAEKLKDTTRHSYTSKGRRESVAEHSWRLMLAAYFVHDEFPAADMDKVMRMCLIHDLGECFTGDIPSFLKTQTDEIAEGKLLHEWVDTLPAPFRKEMSALYAEMKEHKSLESRIYKALDNLEAVIQHNEADISTWEPNEYALQMTYGDDNVAFSAYLKELREYVREDTVDKINAAEDTKKETPAD